MKTPLKIFSLLAGSALAAASFLNAATTDPVGYVTETIKAAQFNTLGLNVHSSAIATGQIDSVSGNLLTDTEADFTNSLSSESAYYIKITNGDNEYGLNTEVSATSATTITTSDDLSSVIAAGSTYTIREIPTIADLFGANNEVELMGAIAGNRDNADLVWIPDGVGGYTKIYYNATPREGFGALTVGWKNTLTGNTEASDTPVYFTNGILIQVKRTAFESTEVGVDPLDLTSKEIVFSGSVDTADSQVVLENGFNAISRVFPANVTLEESQLQLDIDGAAAGDRTNADIVWIPNGTGGYNLYYYNATPREGFGALSVGWKGTLTGDSDASGISLSSGFFIQRKGAATMATLRIPASISL